MPSSGATETFTRAARWHSTRWAVSDRSPRPGFVRYGNRRCRDSRNGTIRGRCAESNACMSNGTVGRSRRSRWNQSIRARRRLTSTSCEDPFGELSRCEEGSTTAGPLGFDFPVLNQTRKSPRRHAEKPSGFLLRINRGTAGLSNEVLLLMLDCIGQ